VIQLGTRWPFGGEPPERVGDAFAAAVADAEQSVISLGVEGDPRDGQWTVTWLEGRPTAIFDLETNAGGTVSVSVNAAGDPETAVHLPLTDEDDAW